MQATWIGLIVLGCVFISLMKLVSRFLLRGGQIKPTQLLRWQMFVAAGMYGALYLSLWGWEIPVLAPRFWQAVFFCSVANAFIQYLNAKAASLEQGEVSLTAPLQAMTPGMITLLAITIGELPGFLGWSGIICMAAGTYYVTWPKQREFWYDHIGPVYRLRLLFRLDKLDPVERSRTLAVCMALASAAFGTFGLLFESLYVRRAGGSMQGIVLGSMVLCFLLGVVYAIFYAAASRKQIAPQMSSEVRRRFAWGLLALGALFVGHWLCIQPGFAHLLTSYVGTLKRLSIILSVILGIILFKEGKDQLKNRLWAAVLVTVGSILISWDGITSKFTASFEKFGF